MSDSGDGSNLSNDCADSHSQEPAANLQRRAVIAVITRGDRFLVIRRSQHVVAPGKLCLPGGKVDPGETDVQTLRREMLEELGIEVVAGREIWRSQTPWGTRLIWWTASIDNAATLRPDSAEVAEVLWMTAAEIKQRSEECLPSLLEFIERFIDRNGRMPQS